MRPAEAPDPLHGPDKPCRRTACVAAEPAPSGDTATHLGGAHLDPRDRAHYDGILTSHNAASLYVREPFKPLLVQVGAFAGPPATTPDSPQRALVETAAHAAYRELDRLRRQVAHVRVDADHKVRDAMRKADDCTHHGQMIKDLERQVNAFDKARDRSEKGRLALLGFLTAIDDFVEKYRTAGTERTTEEIVTALEAAARKTHAAHTRAWKD